MDWVMEFYTKQNEWCGVYSGDPTDDDYKKMLQIERWCGPGQKRILEIGSGGGQRAAAAADLGHIVTAVELLPELAQNGQRLAMQPHQGSLTVVQADFYEVELEDSFDVVCYWDGFGIGSDADQQRLLQRIANYLKPGGCALIDISMPWFWKYAAGQQMQRGKAMRHYEFDTATSRMIDHWWPIGHEEQAITQSIRCYAPVDLRLLLQGTGLMLAAIEAGGAVVYEEERFIEHAPLEQAMAYQAILTHDH